MTKSKRSAIIITAKKLTTEETFRIENSSPENYEYIIWESVVKYNYRAQIDIANIMLDQFKKLVDGEQSETNIRLQENVALRVLQCFFEIADQFALLAKAILERNQRSFYITYIESQNVDARSFYRECVEKHISDQQIKQIWGIDFLEKTINLRKDIGHWKIESATKKLIKSERENLVQLGKTYAEKIPDSQGKYSYTSAVKGAFAVKHGYKYVYPSGTAKKIWDFSHTGPSIMQEIKDVTFRSTGETKSLVVLGSITESRDKLLPTLEKIIRNIQFFSNQISTIATVHLGNLNDQYYMYSEFCKNGDIAIERNDTCFCGSLKKYKKCHYLK